MYIYLRYNECYTFDKIIWKSTLYVICMTFDFSDFLFVEKLLFDDPLFKDFYKTFFKTRSELYEESIARGVKLFSLRQKYKWTDEQFEVIEEYVIIIYSSKIFKQ